MPTNPLLSIVIATHNRHQYAKKAVESILGMNSGDFELIVHDTSDSNDLEEYCSLISDIRLVYKHCGERLSMTENHNRALNLAIGEYVCLIGDDDSVCNKILDVAEWAREHSYDAVCPNIVATYSWPDFKTKVWGDAHSSNAYIDKFSGCHHSISAPKALDDAMKLACQGTDGLPKLYHGLVAKRILDKVKEKNGVHCLGVSPDVSLAIAIASQIQNFIAIDLPLTIPGASGGSNTGRSALNKHKGKLEDDEHIKPFKNLAWPKLVPYFFSVETVWAQAAIETISSPAFASNKDFNYIRLYALCWLRHVENRPEIQSCINDLATLNECSVIGIKLSMWVEIANISMRRAMYLLKRLMNPTPSGGKTVLTGVLNIADAKNAIEKHLKSTEESRN